MVLIFEEAKNVIYWISKFYLNHDLFSTKVPKSRGCKVERESLKKIQVKFVILSKIVKFLISVVTWYNKQQSLQLLRTNTTSLVSIIALAYTVQLNVTVHAVTWL